LRCDNLVGFAINDHFNNFPLPWNQGPAGEPFLRSCETNTLNCRRAPYMPASELPTTESLGCRYRGANECSKLLTIQ
jgi:hypothetical protein